MEDVMNNILNRIPLQLYHSTHNDSFSSQLHTTYDIYCTLTDKKKLSLIWMEFGAHTDQ